MKFIFSLIIILFLVVNWFHSYLFKEYTIENINSSENLILIKNTGGFDDYCDNCFLLDNIDFSSIVFNKELIVSKNILEKLKKLDNKLSEKNLKILITSGYRDYLPDVCHTQGKAIDFLVISSTSSENICQWVDVLEIVSSLEPENLWCEDINNHSATNQNCYIFFKKTNLYSRSSYSC